LDLHADGGWPTTIPGGYEAVTEPVVEQVLNFIREPQRQEFDRLALEVFAFQYERNGTYQRFCDRRRITPDTVSSWKEIPAVPTSAFKLLDLSCAPPEQVFLTSGTSQGAERGRHGFPWLKVYHTSLLTNFAAHLLPDGARPRMLILAPSPDLLPTSSLSHMLEVVRMAYGAEGSAYFVSDEGMDTSGLLRTLREIEARQEPVCLLGTFKGRSREVSREELLRLYQKILAIPEACCVNEYGMTEMGSQFYDNTLSDQVLGRSRPRFKAIPPWVRTRIVDPATLEELPEGEVGLLAHYDLANCGSVMAVETEDLGYKIEEGFEILGRAPGAESRGCSLTVEELQKSR
jgi:hypothetical protein